MTAIDTTLDGVKLLFLDRFADARGVLVKVFNDELMRRHGIDFHPRETFYSQSHHSVIRGMHFQLPPHDYRKLVTCINGGARCVVLDIRRQSPTYGHVFTHTMIAHTPTALFIPSGFAHGFLSLQDNTLMLYQTDASHSPDHDSGVRYDSFNHHWPFGHIVSERDKRLVSFRDFQSPF